MIRTGLVALIGGVLSVGAVVAAPPASAVTYPSCNGADWQTVWVGGFPLEFQAPVVTSSGTLNCVLGSGNQGSAVKALQKEIKQTYYVNLGYSQANISADSIYGADTKAAVKKIQTIHGVTPKDGIYGPKTRAKMCWSDSDIPSVYACGIL
ncbi:MAG: peptidoglycan-binding domain-containing protein [Micropruina sp.]|uniref:peptidoglycan-binding domain-containing protein n=1 Tax=Micropruina sp. TaxID=2737536 RepID=UPI0039E56C73